MLPVQRSTTIPRIHMRLDTVEKKEERIEFALYGLDGSGGIKKQLDDIQVAVHGDKDHTGMYDMVKDHAKALKILVWFTSLSTGTILIFVIQQIMTKFMGR